MASSLVIGGNMNKANARVKFSRCLAAPSLPHCDRRQQLSPVRASRVPALLCRQNQFPTFPVAHILHPQQLWNRAAEKFLYAD